VDDDLVCAPWPATPPRPRLLIRVGHYLPLVREQPELTQRACWQAVLPTTQACWHLRCSPPIHNAAAMLLQTDITGADARRGHLLERPATNSTWTSCVTPGGRGGNHSGAWLHSTHWPCLFRRALSCRLQS
jgi:hypothetical protein